MPSVGAREEQGTRSEEGGIRKDAAPFYCFDLGVNKKRRREEYRPPPF